MKSDILAHLSRYKSDGRAAVLITRLDDGAQYLMAPATDSRSASVDGDETTGDFSPSAAVIAEARRALAADRSTTVDEAGRRYFLHIQSPPLSLIIVGAVHISQSLAPMAAMTGYAVTVVDPRRAFGSEVRFPGVDLRHEWPDEAIDQMQITRRTAIVTLTHDPKLDDPALDRALQSEAFYIAALGSRKTHAARRERLKALGHDDAAIDRIHGPAGLSIGAVSPMEIAVSVMAQMTGVLRGGAATAGPSDTTSENPGKNR